MSDLGEIYTYILLYIGFRVLCFGNKSRQPSCHFTDIPTCKKHWPCAVKIHFAGQQTRPGRKCTLHKPTKKYMIWLFHGFAQIICQGAGRSFGLMTASKPVTVMPSRVRSRRSVRTLTWADGSGASMVGWDGITWGSYVVLTYHTYTKHMICKCENINT